MSIFICEKCGYLSNSADKNNYHHANANIYCLENNKPIQILYKPEFEYFETHRCCERCCDGIEYSDSSGILHPDRFSPSDDERIHWSQYGKEKCLKQYDENPYILTNAKYFFDNNLDKTTELK